MRRYSVEQERTIRAERLARNWLRSGLIDPAQHDRIAPGLRVGLRRTNRFLRLTLFGFGLLIVAAAVALLAVSFDVSNADAAWATCLASGVAVWGLAELLVGRFRLYRFGLEEACATGAAVLVAGGTVFLTESLLSGGSADWELELFIGLITGAVAAVVVYRRFGYLYAAVAAMACAAAAALQLGLPFVLGRLLAAAVLIACVVAARVMHRRCGDEYPGSDYAALHAGAVIGLYAVLNLQLSFVPAGTHRAFYWFTYATIWIVPLGAFLSAVPERNRLLLDASLVMGLATLVTNKPYLGLARETWDPILLGVLLIGAAMALRRWLAGGAGGMRGGFTARRILRSDDDALALAGLATAFRDAPAGAHHDAPPPDPFAGGRSGGGGASGSY